MDYILQVRTHVLSHLKEEWECGTCGIECRSSADLAQHINTEHGEVLNDTNRQYSCGSCDRVFTQPGTLRRHALTHAGGHRSCPLCGKQFGHPGNLKAHLRTHGNERLYSCDGCGCSFGDSSTLQNHLLHHCYLSAAAVGNVDIPADTPMTAETLTVVTPDALDSMTVGTDLADSCNVDDMTFCGFV